MAQLARAVGAPVPIQIDGQTFLCGPITVGDYGALQRRIASQQPDVLKDAAAAAETVDDPEVRKFLLDSAIAEYKRLKEISVEDAVKYGLHTVDGVAFLIWLGIEKNVPGKFTFESMLSHVQKRGMDDYASLVVIAAGLDDPNRQAPTTDGAEKTGDT